MLTNVQCRSAKSQAKPYRLTDSNGLHLEIRLSGGKYWRYRYEIVVAGRRIERLHSLGDFCLAPAGESAEGGQRRRDGRRLTLAEARSERDRVRGVIRQGLCPTQERKQLVSLLSRESAVTFALVAEEWIAAKAWENATRTRRRQMLGRVVYPHIGTLPIKAVNSKHLLELLLLAADQNGPSVAAEAKRSLSGIFGHAIATLRVERTLYWLFVAHSRPIRRNTSGPCHAPR